MPEDDYVEPLTGEEIIVDLCAQIAEKLRKDCNLRDSDAYQSGYSAKIRLDLQLFGMDTASVGTEMAVGTPKADPDPEKDHVVTLEMEIPVEPALNVVRERSDQPVPTVIMESDGKPTIRPRRYVRQSRITVGAEK